MLKIGITGGIGCGKSTVCEVFKQLGASVYNADIEAKKLTNSNIEIREKLIKSFGNDIYLKSGEIDRQKLSSIIFSSKSALTQVNSIIHPVVKQHFDNWLIKNAENIYIIKEAAILFESGAYKDMDFIVTVFAPENVRIKRVMERDGISKEIVQQKIANQLSDSEKVERSNYVIYNDGKHLIIPQILKLHDLFGK
jgi:dephospho-CoA kinase